MINKYLILIGRTFIATFLLVNFFNIIPLNFSNNAWYVANSMLLVDTASLLLLGLSCLKLVPFLEIKKVKFINFNQELTSEDSDIEQKQNYKKNLININKFSTYSMYLFVFIAFLQTFVLFNGINKIDLIYSERMVQIEKKFENYKNKMSSKPKIDSQSDIENNLAKKLTEKNEIFIKITKEANKGKFLLIKNVIKVVLMSLVWAYGFFKLANFNLE